MSNHDHDHGGLGHASAGERSSTGRTMFRRRARRAMSTHGHADHGGQRATAITSASSADCFWIMLILAVPVVGFSMMFSMLVGYSLPDAAWVGWVSPVLEP